ncbi:hypothetical protein J6590_060179 [Homalodisca vitripennis]|nr:hypothetical protein J6590_060179 [Homalodisca vitripennis]
MDQESSNLPTHCSDTVHVGRRHGTRRQKVCHGTDASDLLTACLLKVISTWTRKVATCRLTVQTRYTLAEGMPRYRR